MTKILISAGLGGILPTLCQLAASYSSNPMQPLPGSGVCFALVLFFFVGMTVAFGFEESAVKKAFVLGIAGPAIVTSFVNGAANSKLKIGWENNSRPTSYSGLFLVADANAKSDSVAPSSQNADSPVLPSSVSFLRVSTNLRGLGKDVTNVPVGLKFMASDGKVLSQSTISAVTESNLIVPAGATATEVTIAGASKSTQLPSTTFESARLNVVIVGQPSNDFAWALGGQRTIAIKDLAVSLSDVVIPRRLPKPVQIPASFGKTVIEILAAQLPERHLYVQGVNRGIPSDKLRHALQERTTSKPDAKDVVGLLDGTVLGSASVHLLFTSDGVYVRTSKLSRSGPREGFIEFKDFPNLEFKKVALLEVGIGQAQSFDVSGSGISVEKLIDILNRLKTAVSALQS